MSWRSIGRGGAVVAFVLLSLAGARPGSGDASPPPAAQATPATPAVKPGPITKAPAPAPAAVHVRREIHQLSPPQIDAFRAGVALMKTRKESDPTSWAYQANMHGYPSDSSTCSPPTIPKQVAWASCQHGQFFFISWHRMYLYYFERILRAAIREAIHNPTYEFALPYWDYENPAFHDLPQPYRVPADKTNSLYVAQRAADCNAGRECVDAPTASAKVALSLIPFGSCPGSKPCCSGCIPGLLPDETFGGQFVPAPVHYNRAFGELESQPHNVVHDAIGGDTGWMGDPDCAARDPIFWAHHANIDRLWQVWLNQGGRKNPVNCATWAGNTSFTFFDEKKTKVTMTACGI
ncbi:MAG TPA: tyrosinase family protein, partial [Thermoanaerobaculia bacterium]|nr:tyrosinase family protein [Thermoanaerobaculia bacterium]